VADSYPDQALQHARRALAIAREIAHPFSIVNAHVVNAMVHQLRREPSDSLAHAEAGMSLARTYGMTHETAKAGLFNAWALVMLGRVVQGLAEMRGIVLNYAWSGASSCRICSAFSRTRLPRPIVRARRSRLLRRRFPISTPAVATTKLNSCD